MSTSPLAIHSRPDPNGDIHLYLWGRKFKSQIEKYWPVTNESERPGRTVCEGEKSHIGGTLPQALANRYGAECIILPNGDIQSMKTNRVIWNVFNPEPA